MIVQERIVTALQTPLSALEKTLIRQQADIEQWFQSQWLDKPAVLTCSVDLRHAGYKIAPIDTNLFPAGFNNIRQDFFAVSAVALKEAIAALPGDIKNIALIAESHTRNSFYLQSLLTLQDIIVQAGYGVKIASLTTPEKQVIALPSGEQLTIWPVEHMQDKLIVDGGAPDIILLNNDLSEGVPAILEQVKQPCYPPAALGWSHRLKSEHFAHYESIAQDFAKTFKIDPWLIAPMFEKCGCVDFMAGKGMDCVIESADKMLQALEEKYKQYHIDDKPYLVVKADAGTYGMGVMTIEDPKELCALNRKQRTRMFKSKGKQVISKVIIQEGVNTIERFGEKKAMTEPVIYMLGNKVVGGFYRIHPTRSDRENLNAPGMYFEPMKIDATLEAAENRFYPYAVVARLALLAAVSEVAEVKEG